jgi:tRNA uridine 5-carboxymethylaminomethyl modification enzyme
VRPQDVAATGAAFAAPARDTRAYDLLKRPDVGYADLVALPRIGAAPAFAALDEELAEQVAVALEVGARYSGYIDRQSRDIERRRAQATKVIPEDFDYAAVRGLSNEIREKLDRVRPGTIGQAERIAGMTPAAISLLLVQLKKRDFRKSA